LPQIDHRPAHRIAARIDHPPDELHRLARRDPFPTLDPGQIGIVISWTHQGIEGTQILR